MWLPKEITDAFVEMANTSTISMAEAMEALSAACRLLGQDIGASAIEETEKPNQDCDLEILKQKVDELKIHDLVQEIEEQTEEKLSIIPTQEYIDLASSKPLDTTQILPPNWIFENIDKNYYNTIGVIVDDNE
jgi:hypothetical protein